MPDTQENQSEYPQHFRQKPGCGFPIARIVVLLSLATGAALDFAAAPWSGKLAGENALLRGLRNRLTRGSILLADSYYGSSQEVAALLAMGVVVVMRQYGGRPSDFRRGQRLGREEPSRGVAEGPPTQGIDGSVAVPQTTALDRGARAASALR